MKLFIADAFTNRPFAGNQAAVCLLENHPNDRWLQQLANEMNFSETAYVRSSEEEWELRWFTPACEVDLCGHATLATAHILWNEVGIDSPVLKFRTRSGLLIAHKQGAFIELNFPATRASPIAPPHGLLAALKVDPVFVGASKFDYLVEVKSAAEVRGLVPDMSALRQVEMRGVIVTSSSDDPQCDFISRFFAPAAGVDEDPVTGSAHCCLAPYWSDRLAKHSMLGYQASKRGGTVQVRYDGDRVFLGGQAVTVVRGELSCEATESMV